jgi:hypothetical protein
MPNRNSLLIVWVALAWLVIIAGCVALMSGCASLGGQADVSPAGRGLILVDQYNALEATYKSHYRYATPEVREVMRARVAPVLDEARAAVVLYADIVAGVAGGSTMEQRLAVVDLFRAATLKMVEVIE